MLILVLAANTAFADFPRLASIVARDRYMPRQFMNLGDKLAFSNGIVALSVARGGADRRLRRRSARADPALHDRRVPVVHAVADGHVPAGARLREPGWQTSAAISGFGAVVTFVVLIIVAITKALDGAWIVIAADSRCWSRSSGRRDALRQRRRAAVAGETSTSTRRRTATS